MYLIATNPVTKFLQGLLLISALSVVPVYAEYSLPPELTNLGLGAGSASDRLLGSVPATANGDRVVLAQSGPQPEKIKGRVLNALHNKVVPGAAVSLLDNNGILLDATKTNAEGDFIIDLSVLDAEELSQLMRYSLEITTQTGSKFSVTIQNKALNKTGIIQLSDIVAP